MKKRLLSTLMALCLCLTLVPLALTTAASATGTAVTYTAIDGTKGNTGENYTNLLDGKNSEGNFTKWCVEDATCGAYVVIKASSAVTLESYTFITGNDTATNPGRNPKAWIVYGSNDYNESTTWTMVHEVRDYDGMPAENFESRTFPVMSDTAYQYFKFEITEIVSDNLFQLCGISLSGSADSSGAAAVSPDYSWYNESASEFTVSTAAQLLGFANLVNGADGQTATDFAGKTVKLGADIDLSGIANWTPIGKNGAVFSGTFDGQRKTISKLTVNSTGQSNYVGLFGRTVGATVQNLAVSGSVSGTGTYSEVGGIVGSLGGGSIKNCSFSGSVTGNGNYVGGIAGSISGNSIENCSVSGSVTGSGSTCRVGGIAGSSGSGLISKCKNTATVSGSGSAKALGGIVGDIGHDIKIRYCCNQGELTNYGWYVGGLVGRLTGVYSAIPLRSCYTTFDVNGHGERGSAIGYVDNDNPITVSGIYIPVPANEETSWVGRIEGSDTAIIGEGESKSTDAFASGEVAWLLQNAADASDGQVWGQTLTGGDKDAYPVLADKSGSNTVYKVTFVDDGVSTVKYLNGGTITVSNPTREGSAFGGWYTAATGGTRVTAITSALCDTGDGADANSITLYADWVAVDYSWYNESASEFTVTTAAQLLGFANLVNGADDKTATNFAGKTVKLGADIDLSGIANWTPISNKGSTLFGGTFDGQGKTISKLTVNSTGENDYVGLFGRTVNATVQNLAVSGSVTGTGASSSVGGIIGDLNGGSIENCSFSGSVTGSGNCVGGIAGEASGTISRCSNTATVSGSAFSLGGIVGDLRADIQYCCNQGNISSTSTDRYVEVGGISGQISSASTANINSCYNTGATTAARKATYARIGGIVGLVSSGTALEVTNAYYLNGSVQNGIGETGGSVTGSAVGKNATAFSSGEVTYLLNGRESDGTCTWRQTLSGTSADLFPTLNNKHGVVYYGYTSCAEDNDAMGYGNSYLSSTARPAHQFENGQCKNCTATFTITADKPSYTYGDTATLTVAMTGVTGEKTYQWSKQVRQDYNAISGATSETYITPMLTESGVYKCNVTVNGVRIYSSSVTLTVNKKTATTPALDAKSATYTGSPIEHKLDEALPTGVASAKYEYEGINGTTYTKSETAPTAVGEYSVTVTFTMDEGYEQLAPLTSMLTIQPKPSSGSSRPSYSVTAPETTNGSVTVSPKSAKKGATVTVTVAPDSGYTLETLTVLDKNGNAIELTDLGDGKYSFKMPAGKVSVEASFMDDNSMLNFFTDVTTDKYYYDAVLWAARNGITGGIDENHFGPDLSCARAQLVTFLWRAAGCPVVDYAMNFTDVGDGYYTEAVRWAASLGIVGGYGNGQFGTEDTITREQFMTILYRFAVAMGMDVGVGEDTNILSYNDAFEVSEYAVEAMQWAVGAGIMQGYNGDLMPKAECSRAQIVTMLYRLLGE